MMNFLQLCPSGLRAAKSDGGIAGGEASRDRERHHHVPTSGNMDRPKIDPKIRSKLLLDTSSLGQVHLQDLVGQTTRRWRRSEYNVISGMGTGLKKR